MVPLRDGVATGTTIKRPCRRRMLVVVRVRASRWLVGPPRWHSKPSSTAGTTDAAQGQRFSVSPDIAADGIDEFLDVFVAASRAAHESPPGPTMSFECSDRSDQWWLDLSGRGVRIVSRDSRTASVGIRGTAEQLLLMVWGRVPISDAAGAEVSGDIGELDRWLELIPPM